MNRSTTRGALLFATMLLTLGCGKSEPPQPLSAATPAPSPAATAPGVPTLLGGAAPTLEHRPSLLADSPPIRSWRDWDLADTAADALGRIGPPAVPALIQQLQNPEVLMRREAAEILSRIGPEAAPAIPALLQAMNDPDTEVRKYSIRAIGQIGPAAAPAVPALINTLERERLAAPENRL